MQFYNLEEVINLSSYGPSSILNKSEESTLVKRILHCHKKGFSGRKEDDLYSVKQILDTNPRENSFKNNFQWMV